jgi:hypothetical protein
MKAFHSSPPSLPIPSSIFLRSSRLVVNPVRSLDEDCISGSVLQLPADGHHALHPRGCADDETVVYEDHRTPTGVCMAMQRDPLM